MTYAAEVRVALQALRAKGLPFDQAWARAMADLPAPVEWAEGQDSPLRFMRRVYRDAYYGREVPAAGLAPNEPSEGHFGHLRSLAA